MKSKRARSPQNLTSDVARCLRGGTAFPDTMVLLHRLLSDRPADRLDKINRYLLENTFKILPGSFGTALRFDHRHIDQLTWLVRAAYNRQLDMNYLRLATEYVLINTDRVEPWIDFDIEASALLIKSNPEAIRDILLTMPAVDQQAFTSLRLYSALHPYSDTTIKDFLEKNLTSAWTKSRLLYPTIYFFTNLPSPQALDQMLSHLLPQNRRGETERQLIKLMLEPHRNTAAPLTFRAYAALMSHPFDALEYLVGDLENRIARTDDLDPVYLEDFRRLAGAFPRHRVARILRLVDGERLPLVERPHNLSPLGCGSDTPEGRVILAILDAARESPPRIAEPSQLMSALINLRWNRYPTRSDYDVLNIYRQRFSMLTAGVFIDFVSRSQFLFEREDTANEVLALLRGIMICEVLTPFILTSPGGYQAVISGAIKGEIAPTRLVTEVTASLGKTAELRTDRIWIKAANWALMPLQQSGRVEQWAKQARKKFQLWVEPRYLSGLDWSWLTRIVDKIGLLPLRDNSDGVYVLFMRQLEEGLRESVALRIAVEPIVTRYREFPALRDWIFAEFGQYAAAFVRVFLTADTLQKLRLASNYTAALTTRVTLLEACIREYGFIPGIVSEQDFLLEEGQLTATLSRMSLGARQFEIPWATLKEDAITRNTAAYDAYETMAQAVGENVAVTAAVREFTYPFANGAIQQYEVKNRDWPLAIVIGGVIDTILSHPTLGIEAILSVRIRHDSFRREFASAIQSVQQGNVVGVRRVSVQHLTREFGPSLYREIQSWLDAHMHTVRKTKPDGFFDFMPCQKDMAALVEASRTAGSLGAIVDLVVRWAQPRLDDQLALTRASVEKDLAPVLAQRTRLLRQQLIERGGDEQEITRVAQAIGASVSRRATEIQEWFKVPEGVRCQGLTVAEIWQAVEERFRLDIMHGRLVYPPLPTLLAQRNLAPHQIRHLYDLMSEILRNALKHSGITPTRLRVTLVDPPAGEFVIFSNWAAEGPEEDSEEVEGHPYATLHDSLFGEGKSGTKKVAYLAASIARRVLLIRKRRKGRSYHVIVPIASFGTVS